MKIQAISSIDHGVAHADAAEGQEHSIGRLALRRRGAEQVPTISIDYGFFSKRLGEGQATGSCDGRSLPVLLVKDRSSGVIASLLVPSKGA